MIVRCRIVASTMAPSLVSQRVLSTNGIATPDLPLREALTAAGFRPGDIVTIQLAAEEVTVT